MIAPNALTDAVSDGRRETGLRGPGASRPEMPRGFRSLAKEDAPFAEMLERELAPLRSDRPLPIDRRPESGAEVPLVDALDRAESRERRLREAGEGFEALFYRQMVQQFRKSVSENGLFGSGPGKDVYEGMFDDLLSTELARSGRLGIADFFLRSVR